MSFEEQEQMYAPYEIWGTALGSSEISYRSNRPDGDTMAVSSYKLYVRLSPTCLGSVAGAVAARGLTATQYTVLQIACRT